eukprot:CAMPEP_0194276956 /NCGR_PEP_ID=MMETSP0169-20130528/9410_1 /TAXON_ID=218684 /ORGANISM="Corethron pennatum, Strain L29A3" /LENGTH=134 /DNA_ID=CAMNT_0039020801 /DNA_START=313 /DNA_END=720 /DNA_ORIENTATION=-
MKAMSTPPSDLVPKAVPIFAIRRYWKLKVKRQHPPFFAVFQAVSQMHGLNLILPVIETVDPPNLAPLDGERPLLVSPVLIAPLSAHDDRMGINRESDELEPGQVIVRTFESINGNVDDFRTFDSKHGESFFADS